MQLRTLTATAGLVLAASLTATGLALAQTPAPPPPLPVVLVPGVSTQINVCLATDASVEALIIRLKADAALAAQIRAALTGENFTLATLQAKCAPAPPSSTTPTTTGAPTLTPTVTPTPTVTHTSTSSTTPAPTTPALPGFSQVDQVPTGSVETGAE